MRLSLDREMVRGANQCRQGRRGGAVLSGRSPLATTDDPEHFQPFSKATRSENCGYGARGKAAPSPAACPFLLGKRHEAHFADVLLPLVLGKQIVHKELGVASGSAVGEDVEFAGNGPLTGQGRVGGCLDAVDAQALDGAREMTTILASSPPTSFQFLILPA